MTTEDQMTTENKTTDWREQLAFLDNPTQGPENIKDRELVLRLLAAIMYTGNSFDSDDCADWQHGYGIEGDALYEAGNQALRRMGAQHIPCAMDLNGQYTFGIDAPDEAQLCRELGSFVADNEWIEDETSERQLYYEYVMVSWDGAKCLQLDSFTQHIDDQLEGEALGPWRSSSEGYAFIIAHRLWLGMSESDIAAIAKTMTAKLAQLKAEGGAA